MVNIPQSTGQLHSHSKTSPPLTSDKKVCRTCVALTKNEGEGHVEACLKTGFGNMVGLLFGSKALMEVLTYTGI